MNTRARLTALALSAAVGILPLAAVAPAAQAHDGGEQRCVSRHEWQHIHRSMKKWRVHRIFDVRGRFVDGFAGGYTRRYRPCAWGGGTDVRLYVSYSSFSKLYQPGPQIEHPEWNWKNRVLEKRLV